MQITVTVDTETAEGQLLLALLRQRFLSRDFLEKAAAQAQAALDPVATPLPTTSVIPTNRQLAAAKARAAKDAKENRNQSDRTGVRAERPG